MGFNPRGTSGQPPITTGIFGFRLQSISAVPLVAGDTDGEINSISGCTAPWHLDAGATVGLLIKTPAFSKGTLTVVYAELDVSNPGWTEAISVGRDSPLALTSGDAVEPLVLDDNSENPGAGSDLSVDLAAGTVSTAAGGIFVIGFNINFATSADFAS